MSDLQTAMQQILQSWEQPETTEEPMFKTTTNTSRATFEMVRDNPGLLKKEYIRKLEASGFKKASVSSLLSQMVRQGHIWVGNDEALRANGKEYVPLKALSTRKTKKVKTSKLRTFDAPVDRDIARLIERPVLSKTEDILDNISLSDAHELYRKLHQYFGGLPK